MEKKYIGILALLALLLFAGCTASSKSCCSRADAFPGEGIEPVCTSSSGATIAPLPYGNAKMPNMRLELRCCAYPPVAEGEEGTVTGSHPNECPVDENNGYCKVAYYRCTDETPVQVGGSCIRGGRPAYPNGQFIDPNAPNITAKQTETISVCIDDKPNVCVNEQCRVQLCGKDAQISLPAMSAQDASAASETFVFNSPTAQGARNSFAAQNPSQTFTDEQWQGVVDLERGGYITIKSEQGKKFKVEKKQDGTFDAYSQNKGVDVDKIDLSIAGGDSRAINLYGATCSIEPMNKLTLNRVKKASGTLWANTFRFGVGSNFSDYEEARLYFPTSDQYCGVPTGGTKDRYMNYKLPYDANGNPINTPCPQVPNNVQKYMCGTDAYATQAVCEKNCGGQCTSAAAGAMYVCIRDNKLYANQNACVNSCHNAPSTDLLTCASSRASNAYPYSQNPFLSSKGNYAVGEKAYVSGGDCSWGEAHHNDYRGCGYGHGENFVLQTSSLEGTNYYNAIVDAQIEANPKYYSEYFRNTQYFADQAVQGYFDAQGNHHKGAEYMCQSGSECMSGYCNTIDAPSFTCVDRDGNEIGCGCSSNPANPQQGTVCAAGGTNGQQLNYNQFVMSYSCAAADGEGGYGYGQACTCTVPVPVYSGGECVSGCSAVCSVDETYQRIDISSYSNGYRQAAQSGQAQAALYTGEIGIGMQDNGEGWTTWRVSRSLGGSWQYASPSFKWVEVNDVGRYRSYIRQQDVDGGLVKFLHECQVPAQDISMAVVSASEVGSAQTDSVAVRVDVFPRNGAIGRCIMNDQGSGVELVKRGWCEPCTYATVAVQKVGASLGSGAYCPLYSATKNAADYNAGNLGGTRLPLDSAETLSANRSGTDYAHFYRQDICEAGGNSGPKCDWYFNDQQLQCRPDQPSEYWPMLWPNEVYLHEKLNTYLSSSVMPVLDVRDSYENDGNINVQSNGASALAYSGSGRFEREYVEGEGEGEGYYSYSYTFAADKYKTLIGSFLKDRGAVTVVIANVEDMMDDQSGRWNFWAANGVGGMDWCSGDGCDAKPNNARLGVENNYWAWRSLYQLGDVSGKYLTNREYYLLKAKVIKEECPNCLIAVGAKSRSAYSAYLSHLDEQTMYNVQNPLDKLFLPTRAFIGADWVSAEPLSDNIDLIVQDWYIDYNAAANAPVEVDAQVDFAGKMTRKYHKPLLEWNLTVATANPTHFANTLGEIFGRQRDLSSSGVMGIVYQNWRRQPGMLTYDVQIGDRLTTGNRGAPFCAIENASRKMAGVKEVTFYQKLYAQETCECLECTQEEISEGLCGYENSKLQTPGRVGETCAIAGNANPQPSAFAHYRAPPSCITNQCVPCSETAGSAVCSRISEGTKTSMGSIRISTLTSNERDIIGALAQASKCCLNDSNGNYTYIAYSGAIANNEQVLYHKSGLLSFDCGKTPDLSPSVCGIGLDVENANVTCTWKED